MPNYPTDPNIIRDILDLKRRMKIVEAQLANRTGPPGPGGGPVYDSNVIWNGRMESGTLGWARWFFGGTIGTTHVDDVNPLDGIRSLRMDENASSFTRLIWLPGGSTASPQVGSDVFATAPGEVWKLSALAQSSAAAATCHITAICGAAPANCYGLSGANTSWIDAVNVPLTAGVTATLSGTVTVPAGRSYITFSATGNDTSLPASAWSWWLDDVALQKQL